MACLWPSSAWKKSVWAFSMAFPWPSFLANSTRTRPRKSSDEKTASTFWLVAFSTCLSDPLGFRRSFWWYVACVLRYVPSCLQNRQGAHQETSMQNAFSERSRRSDSEKECDEKSLHKLPGSSCSQVHPSLLAEFIGIPQELRPETPFPERFVRPPICYRRC